MGEARVKPGGGSPKRVKPTDGEGAKLNTAALEGPNSFGQPLAGLGSPFTTTYGGLAPTATHQFTALR